MALTAVADVDTISGMRYLHFVLATLLFAALLLARGPALAQGGTAPAVPLPGKASVLHQSEEAFATYPLITDRIDQRGGIKGNMSATRTVEGALARRTYRLPGGDSVSARTSELRQRLESAGFNVLFECEGEACGTTFVRASPGYRRDKALFSVPLSAQHYLAVQRADGDSDVYAAAQVARTVQSVVVQLDTLRVKAREIGAISVNAAQMASDLAAQGRVALYGVFFSTDSADIKPASRPTLGEIAKLMSEKPQMRLLVVGHTDSRGSFKYNIDLSSRRAQAVVRALVRDYGLDSDRLKPWGVGYAAPRASNKSDIGQAQNRRVELVIW